jgi:hypothetical protein
MCLLKYPDINKIGCTNQIMSNNFKFKLLLNNCYMVASHRQFTDEAEKLFLGSSMSLCTRSTQIEGLLLY